MELPSTQVHAAARTKPRLAIFDDSAKLLARFTKTFAALGYDVIPVYVSDGYPDTNYDRFIANATFRRGLPEPIAADDFKGQDASSESKHTLDTELADAKVRTVDGKARHLSAYEQLAMMSGFSYAVKSKDDVAAVLRQIKPDCVLSDMEMRRPADPDMPKEAWAADPDVIMGTDIMTAASALGVPCAIHTGQYTIQDEVMARIDSENKGNPSARDAEINRWHTRYAKLCAQANDSLEVDGYRIFPKDATGETHRAEEIHRYLQASRSKSLGIGPA